MNSEKFWTSLFFVSIGIVWMLDNAGILASNVWRYYWPTVMILYGVRVLFRKK